MAGDRYQDHSEPDTQGNASDDAMVAYRTPSEESTPLLPGRTQRKISPAGYKLLFYGFVALSIFLFSIVNLYFHFMSCPLYPATMDAIRQEWRKEEMQHVLFEEKWRLEQLEHSIIEDEWELQKEWHEKSVAHRIQEENKRQERVRRDWAQEYERHVREAEEYEEAVARRVHEEQVRQEGVRKEWDREGREHDKEVMRRNQEEAERREKVRREWSQEVVEHKSEWEDMMRRENERRENERLKWWREIEDHDQIIEERKKREEEERQKLNMFWSHVEAHGCPTYSTKEYTARLMNLPATWEHPMEACKATPLEVHGISYLPKSCEDKGPGIVIGRWEINQREPDCNTFWNWYKDKGCTSPGSGKRRIEHYLENLPHGSDWREFCATTPARFNGLEFSGAEECFQYKLGTYGHWEIDDVNCN